MSHLPIEIYSLIFRLATNVPEACDTSFNNVELEDRDAKLRLIHGSMLTKTSLSLVSNKIHHIMELLLYEIIIIYRFDFVPILLNRLRMISPGHFKPRGHTCRRLDLYLGIKKGLSYLDEAWYEGGHTLWGLIPACPRLEVLIAQVNNKERGTLRVGVPHLTHNALWKTISIQCAGTLRRLDLFGFHIRMDRVEMMLRYMSNLEVCHIAHSQTFKNIDIWGSHQRGQWKPHAYDDEEPKIRRVSVEKGMANTLGSRISVSLRQSQKARKQITGWFDQKVRAEFDDALVNAVWPPFQGGPPPYVLPKLHILYLGTLDERFFQFRFPVLKSLSTAHIENPRSLFEIDADPTYLAYGDLEPIFGGKPDSSVFDDNIRRVVVNCRKGTFTVKTKYYPKPPPNSSLFGSFPNTITALFIPYEGLELDKVLYFFPNVKHLTWHVDKVMDSRDSSLLLPHLELQYIVIVAKNRGQSAANVIDEVLDAVEDKKLPRLRIITVYSRLRPRIPLRSLPMDDSEELGVVLRTMVIPSLRLTSLYF